MAETRDMTQEAAPAGFFQNLRLGLRLYGLLGTLGRGVLMADARRRFMQRGDSPEAQQLRKRILREFDDVQRHVLCAHSPVQFLTLAEYLLNLDVRGDLVECGAYKGGSSSKLSILAKHTGRRLFVCDSFQGLPRPANDTEAVLKGAAGFPDYVYREGMYAGGLEEVRENVRRHGCIDVCEFVPGFFADTLPGLDVRPAFVFTDVDLVSSARDCLLHLWPRLAPGGYWFTHEASFLDYVYGMLDADWWREHLGETPPPMIGAGSGLNLAHVAYIRKPLPGETGHEAETRALTH